LTVKSDSWVVFILKISAARASQQIQKSKQTSEKSCENHIGKSEKELEKEKYLFKSFIN
jgi:guanylate kinase